MPQYLSSTAKSAVGSHRGDLGMSNDDEDVLTQDALLTSRGYVRDSDTGRWIYPSAN